MQLNKDYFMAAEDFTECHELTTDGVIERIQSKVLDGKRFELMAVSPD